MGFQHVNSNDVPENTEFQITHWLVHWFSQGFVGSGPFGWTGWMSKELVGQLPDLGEADLGPKFSNAL